MALTPGQNYTPQQIYQEDPEWLKRNAPAYYDAFNKQTQGSQSVTQGAQDITGKALSNVQQGVQTEAVTQTAPTPTTQTPPQVDSSMSQNIKAAYQAAWQKADSLPKRQALATDFKTATGQDLFKLYLPPDQIEPMSTTFDTLNQINLIKKGLGTDPKLKAIIGNPEKNLLVKTLLGLPAGQSMVQNIFGLNDDGMQSLSSFVKLQAQGDRNLIGGPLRNYMVELFGPAFPGIGQTYSVNQKLLDNMESQINKNLDFVAKNNGFAAGWKDIPGAESFYNKEKPSLKDIFKK